MAYNPFDVSVHDIHKLTASDLQKLIVDRVREGYWVEYKRTFPENSKVAKSIASFANTYGGWYFIGVEADSTDNVAQTISGFSLGHAPNPIDKLREIVKSHIDPVPIFYTTLVHLDSGNAVLVVYVPDNQETPFVNRDGRVYRRVADSSDPIPETNRYAVDRLVDNGRRIGEEFRQFCKDERTFGRNEVTGWVNIYVAPYPLHEFRVEDSDSFAARVQRFKELSLRPLQIPLPDGEYFGTGNLPFSSAQPTTRSILLRQNSPHHLPFNTLEAELYFDGRAKFFIPIQPLPKWDSDAINQLKSTEVKRALIPLFQENYNIYLLTFINIEQVWSAVMVLLSYHWHWYNQENTDFFGHTTQFKMAVHINDVWRNVAFLDSDVWGSYVQEYGLPIMNRESVQFPRQGEENITFDITQVPLWLVANSITCTEFGLPENLFVSVFASVSKKANQTTESR